jgi:T4 RnlA family RNA ligase
LEWCSPYKRVALSYAEPTLTVLNVRRHTDGEYFDVFRPSAVGNESLDPIRENYIERLTVDDAITFVSEIPAMEGVEGYVVELESGQRVKIKTEWYLVQHRAKDSINSPRRLFEACIEEATDDLRSLFFDDPIVIALIDEMEKFADSVYNHTVDTVERFYERNKHLERKEYAILGQNSEDLYPKCAKCGKCHVSYFGLAMSKYLGREVDYKEFMRKNYKSFGVADEPANEVE